MALREDQERIGGVMRLALGAAILLAAPGCATAEAPPQVAGLYGLRDHSPIRRNKRSRVSVFELPASSIH